MHEKNGYERSEQTNAQDEVSLSFIASFIREHLNQRKFTNNRPSATKGIGFT